jgi:hypothetical protein
VPENAPPVWSLKPFLIRAVVWALLAAAVWKYTTSLNADFTIGIVKLAHSLAGRPAPYLFCDEYRLFWHATMFPPMVGLILGSYWLGWFDRIVRAAFGYVAQCVLTGVAITIHESPYLQQNDFINVVTANLVNAHYLLFGVVIWVLVAGPWYSQRSRDASTEDRSLLRRAWDCVRRGWAIRLVLLCVGVGATIPLFAMTGSDAAMAARSKLGRALSEVPFFPQPSNAALAVSPSEQRLRDDAVRRAMAELQGAILADQADDVESAALWHLTGHLLISLRPETESEKRDLSRRALMALTKARKSRRRR